MIREISNPILEHLVYKLRDPETDRVAFRKVLEDVGQHIGIEIAKNLMTREMKVTTLMKAEATHRVLAEDPLLMPILRAGDTGRHWTAKSVSLCGHGIYRGHAERGVGVL